MVIHCLLETHEHSGGEACTILQIRDACLGFNVFVQMILLLLMEICVLGLNQCNY